MTSNFVEGIRLPALLRVVPLVVRQVLKLATKVRKRFDGNHRGVNIMNLVGIQSQPQLVIKGLVILAAVFFSSGDGPRRLVRCIRSFGRKKA
jgi:hypothetical protein